MSEKTEIKASKNGPYLISVNEVSVNGEPHEHGKMIALCRCGGSSNKPFCDGTHKKKNFEAEEVTVEVS